MEGTYTKRILSFSSVYGTNTCVGTHIAIPLTQISGLAVSYDTHELSIHESTAHMHGSQPPIKADTFLNHLDAVRKLKLMVTDRQTDRQAGRHTHTCINTQARTRMDTHTDRHTHTHTHTHRHTHTTYTLTNKHSTKRKFLSLKNKLILQYLKTRRCKYYTLHNHIMIQYYSFIQKFTWNKLNLRVQKGHSRHYLEIIRIRY